eukprot:GHVH01006664.1.p1 GENE.GHVH01006664.1~~GHVH01006664.1.p1  ORF type:complete len:791 (+),score=116.20 GHVH01006664.1:72-2444(+)
MLDGLKGIVYQPARLPLLSADRKDDVLAPKQYSEDHNDEPTIEPHFYTQVIDESPPHYLKHYIDYDKIKRAIHKLSRDYRDQLRSHGLQSVVLDAVLEKFKNSYRLEIDKVNEFCTLRAQYVVVQLSELVTKSDGLVDPSASSKEAFVELANSHLLCLEAEIIHLDRFVRANLKIGCRLIQLLRCCIESEADSSREYSESSRFSYLESELQNEMFCNLDIDSLVMYLSVGWDRLRKLQMVNQPTSDSKGIWTPPVNFVRTTTKYWVPADRLVDCKSAIVRNMPFLIFGKDVEVCATLLKEAAESQKILVCGDEPVDSQLVSSVYLDSPDATMYRHRIMRYEGAKIVRYRWYGNNYGCDDKLIYIERKTHHEGWSGLESTKQRFTLHQTSVPPFLKGELSKEELNNKVLLLNKTADSVKLANEVNDLQVKLKLEPMLRTSYHRCAFQLSSSNEVRFSLDHNLCMINERANDAEAGLPSGAVRDFWCKSASDAIVEDSIVRFPFAILEVKLQTEQPQWVSQMLAGCGAISVDKFSKFQHGMAMLHEKILLDAPLPHWIDECVARGWIRGFAAKSGPAMPYQAADVSASIRPQFESTMLMSTLTSGNDASMNHRMRIFTNNLTWTFKSNNPSCLTSGFQNYYSRVNSLITDEGEKSQMTNAEATLHWYEAKKALEASMREASKQLYVVDPKVQFATERVFLKYCRKGIYLLPFIMLSLEKDHIMSATLITIATILLIVYGWVQYIKRVGILESEKNKGVKYEDRPYIHSLLGPKIILSTLGFTFAVYAIGNYV